MLFEIKSRFDGSILFALEIESFKLCVEAAVKSKASLVGANLDGANLYGANLDIPVATREEAIKNLDVVGEIILHNQDVLEMGHWHDEKSDWKNKTCAEEAVCGTTHCLAGWLQVCAANPKVKELEPQLAGIIQAPIASHMFYETNARVVEWPTNREYAK